MLAPEIYAPTVWSINYEERRSFYSARWSTRQPRRSNIWWIYEALYFQVWLNPNGRFPSWLGRFCGAFVTCFILSLYWLLVLQTELAAYSYLLFHTGTMALKAPLHGAIRPHWACRLPCTWANRSVWHVARMSRTRENRVKRIYSSFYFRADSAARAGRLPNQSAANT